jgi:hypothetical protein
MEVLMRYLNSYHLVLIFNSLVDKSHTSVFTEHGKMKLLKKKKTKKAMANAETKNKIKKVDLDACFNLLNNIFE